MRILAISMLTLFLVTANPSNSQDKTKSNNPQRKTSTQPSDKAPTTVVQVNLGHPTEAKNSDPTKANTSPEKKPFMTVGEIVISLITAVYAIVSIFTFYAIKRQADNAVNMERAWIDFRLLHDDGEPGYSLSVSNYGRTIGKIDSYTLGIFVTPFQGTLKSPPDYPKETVSRKKINRIVSPNDNETIDYLPVHDFFAEEWKEINGLVKKAFFFVTVAYEDTAGGMHHTDGCYMFSTPSYSFVDMPEKKRYK